MAEKLSQTVPLPRFNTYLARLDGPVMSKPSFLFGIGLPIRRSTVFANLNCVSQSFSYRRSGV